MRATRRLRGATAIVLLVSILIGTPHAAHAQAGTTNTEAQPPPSARSKTGTVEGTIIDSLSGRPIIGASVTVVATKASVTTDKNGKYRLNLPVGAQHLRVSADKHEARELAVTVVDGMAVSGDAALAEQSSVLNVFQVFAEIIRGSESAQVEERKQAATVAENVGAETIAQSPDSDAAEVVQRMSGVTVKDDKFIFVRGLGERYSSALLNGSRLPSTNPDKRVVGLDLFPSAFLDSLSITKSYTPDLPGDFSGGLVDIRLKEFPDKLTYSIGVSTGGNTETTFQDFQTYKGSDLDYFGFGAGFRERPDVIPDDILDPTTPETTARQRELNAAFRNIWSTSEKTAPPNLSTGFSVGNSWGPFGVSLGGTYGNSFSVRRKEYLRSFYNDEYFTNHDFQGAALTYNRSKFETQLGGLLTAGYRFRENDKISLRSFVNRSSSDEVLDGVGINDNRKGLDVIQRRLQYREEQLGFGQLSGQHFFGPLQVDWRTAGAETRRNDPDTRLSRQTRDPSDPMSRPAVELGSLLRTFVDLQEVMSDSAVDLTVPFSTHLPFTTLWDGLEAKAKTGVAYTLRDREMTFRRFGYLPGNIPAGFDLTQPIEDIVGNPANIGVSAIAQFNEQTRPLDKFDATQEIAGTYGMLELPLVRDQLRAIGGARLEYSYIQTNFSQSTNGSGSTFIHDLDVIPGVNLVWTPISDMNVRYGFSQTVSRPEFRELTPTEFPVPDGERSVEGNPTLSSASISSHDLRWEWFFSDVELVSVGGFYKDLTNVVEQVTLSRTSSTVDSFRNADAFIYGIEVEGRKNLGVLASWLPKRSWTLPLNSFFSNTMFLANAAWIDSEASVDKLSGAVCNPILNPNPPRECTETQTSEKRSLQGQPEFTVNASLDYTSEDWGAYHLLYNTVGRKIVAAGVDGLPDIYEERRDQLDAVWTKEISPFDTPLEMKAAIENLLDDSYKQTQGGATVVRYHTGVRFSVGVSYKF